MKKIFSIGLLIIIIFIIGIFVYYNNHKLQQRLELITEQGVGIHDFYIENDKVYIIGGVTIKNNTVEEVSFSLSAKSEVDYSSGLIKSEILEGFDETLSTNKFSIKGHETLNIKVKFVGDHGGYDKKNNRLMPEITIIES